MDEEREQPSTASDGRRRPYKVWDSRRYTKKGLVANSLEELLARGRDKLHYDVTTSVYAVLESDGTTVDDAEYFASLPDNTVFLLLRETDRWLPPGVDVLRAALTCIPRIVCQTMHAMELRDAAPSWKIADNRGQVTIQLHWDTADGAGAASSPGRRAHIVVRGVGETPYDHHQHKAAAAAAAVGARQRTEEAPPPYAGPSTTVQHQPGRLSRQGSSVESATSVHVHTAECGQHHHHPHTHHPHHHHVRATPGEQCDFHCCALHGGGTAVKKSTATSPIREPPPPPPVRRPALSHVRFDEGAKKDNGPALQATGGAAAAEESSESEGDNTANEEGVSEKLLLLVDQLSVERMRYLSIKDIGVILERLSSKILDVERMEREKEGDDCHNWTLKATIRGDVLRDIGVVYHGHYYSIGEHPSSEPPPAEPPPPQ